MTLVKTWIYAPVGSKSCPHGRVSIQVPPSADYTVWDVRSMINQLESVAHEMERDEPVLSVSVGKR